MKSVNNKNNENNTLEYKICFVVFSLTELAEMLESNCNTMTSNTTWHDYAMTMTQRYTDMALHSSNILENIINIRCWSHLPGSAISSG